MSYKLYSKQVNSIWLLCILGVIWIFIGMQLPIGSQWYTSTGALLCGMYVAKKDIDLRYKTFKARAFIIIVTLFTLLFGSLGNKLWSDIVILKNLLVIISGIAFSFFVYIVMLLSETCINGFWGGFLEKIGMMSLWLYIVHMKVIEILGRYLESYFLLYILLTLLVASIAYYIWGCIGKKYLINSFYHEKIMNKKI